MKKLTSILLLLLFAWTVQAQTAREEVRTNRYLPANNYYAYLTPTAKQTAAPKGHESFYISIHMHHGSRCLIDPNNYCFPKRTLLKVDSLSKLTVTGKNTLGIVLCMVDMAGGRLGELTSVGARRHRRIAERIRTNFPQIFAGGTEVDARPTVVIRCILSMTSEYLQLQAMDPNLYIKNDIDYYDMYYMNPPAKDLSKIASSDKVKKVRKNSEAIHVRPQRLMETLLTDETYVKANIDEARLIKRLFDLACNMQSHDTDMQLYSLFTDEEYYDLWSCNNLYWYLIHACFPVTDGLMPYREADLLRNVLDRVDAALKEGKNQATLGFDHESCLLSLVTLLELSHCGEFYPNAEKLSEQWRVYDIFPMASNVQFVFFHKKGGSDVLVKVLLNEKETKLPMKAGVAPYYYWEDVEGYYREKLDKYQYI